MIARVMAGRADQNEEDRFSTGIAVRNVIDRLQLYYKRKKICLTIESDGPGKGTRSSYHPSCVIKMNWNENNVEILHNKGETEECIEF